MTDVGVSSTGFATNALTRIVQACGRATSDELHLAAGESSSFDAHLDINRSLHSQQAPW